MDRSEVGVLEERDEVGLGGLLEGHDGRGLEPEVGLEGARVAGQRPGPTATERPQTTMTHLEVLCNLTHQPLEGQLPDQQLRGLLVATDFTEGDYTAVSVCPGSKQEGEDSPVPGLKRWGFFTPPAGVCSDEV